MSKASRKKQKGQEFEKENILQAVIIADSFNVRFAPVTALKPRSLLPMANVPLLEYTMEFLCSAGIQEVVVFCCTHAQQIKEYLMNSKWSNESSPLEVITVISETCLSVGDALRDIDAKSLITNDFVLVNGDMVANVKLKPIIEEHKARRLKDKSTMMTMLFRKASPGHSIRSAEDEVVLAVRPEDNRVLHYQKLGAVRKLDFPVKIFSDNKSVQLRHDLLNSHICICSPHVPQLFTDNFDFSTTDDFVRGILVDEEILGNTIHIHILEYEYAARVSNLHMYAAVSKDILTRWVYPMVPDSIMSGDHADAYTYGRHNIYLSKDIVLARGCTLKENVMIGQGSSIGSNTYIVNSVIGRNCRIGGNVHMDGVYVWNDSQIDDDCKLSVCLIDCGVHIKKNCQIMDGCVLAANVVLGPNVTLPKGMLLTAQLPDSEWEDNIKTDVPLDIVGEEGHGYVYELPSDSDAEDELMDVIRWGLPQKESEEESESSSSDEESDDDRRASPVQDEPKMFYEEVICTLERDLTENIGRDNMILEVNSLKHAYGIQIKEVNQLLTKAIVSQPLHSNPKLELTDYLQKIIVNLKRFMPLLQNYIRNEESQLDCLISLGDFAVESSTERVLAKVIHFVYEADLMSEMVILKWHKLLLSSNSQAKKDVAKQVAPFIKWLEEADEESEDSD